MHEMHKYVCVCVCMYAYIDTRVCMYVCTHRYIGTHCQRARLIKSCVYMCVYLYDAHVYSDTLSAFQA
jgi:hypothetical protein